MRTFLKLDKMTVEEAREILGNECIGISDEQIHEEIEMAEFFKDAFFELRKCYT
jgi:thiamine monophosphate synthase